MQRRIMASGLAAAALGAVGFATLGAGQPEQAGQPAQAGAGGPDLGQLLVDGLRRTEGCLGVDGARFDSGRNTIVAWFEDKAAAARWYHSPTHTRMLRMVGGDPADREPLERVAEGVPVMVMASITFGGEPAVPGSPIPFRQISIEMYTPLPGGAAINGRLAPHGFPVEHFRWLDTIGDEG